MKPIAFLSSAFAAASIAGGAFAHGVLQSSSPAANAALDHPPAELQLHFNEALEPEFSSVKLSDDAGAALAAGTATVDAADPRTIVAKAPKLATGRYTVHWSVMTRDGHRTHGDYAFTVK